MAIFKKIPNWSELASVYVISVLFVYGWTIYWFLWKLPSWIYYLSVAEVLLISVYSAATNFLESLLLLCVPLILVMLFPKKYFFDRFVSVGGLLNILIGVYFIYFSSVSEASTDFSYSLLMQAVIFFAVSICIALLAGRVLVISRIVETLADRLKVFLYISLPVSLLSVLLIVARNLFRYLLS